MKCKLISWCHSATEMCVDHTANAKNCFIPYPDKDTRSPGSELQSLRDRIAELEADKERMDWLSDECYLPNDHPEEGIFMVVDEKSLSFGSYTGRTKEDRAAVRNAIDKAREQSTI